MNTVTPEKKQGMLKALAVLGFLAIIGFIAWASVQIVEHAPKAFNSLASLAEGISHYSDSLIKNDAVLTLSSTSTVTEAGKPFILSWNKQPKTGTYAFSYTCVDGVAVDIVDTEGLRSIACNTRYGLGDTDTVSIIVDSEKQAQAEVGYTITYSVDSDFGPSLSVDNKVTVTNTKLAAVGDETVLGVKDKTEWKDTIAAPAKQPEKVTPVTTPTAKPRPVYTTPVSNPNGFTDLATKFVATGFITGNTFNAGVIKQNSQGGFQFSITNLGTKTSESWSYIVTLPDGDIYTSPLQAPLLPGEQATIALGFSTRNIATYNLVVAVAEKSDLDLKNNTLSQKIHFVK